MLLIIFGSVFGNQNLGEGLDITFAQYFVAGMIASGVLYTSFQNLAIAIPMERDDGTLKRIQGTPMPKVSYFLGKIGLVFVAYVAQVTILIVVGVLFYKIQLPSTATQWFTFAWASVLGLVSCTLLGIAFSVVPKNGKGASAVVSPIVLVLQFTSGVFFVFAQLPEWMQTFASFFPLKWLTQARRSVFRPDAAQALDVRGSWVPPRCRAGPAASTRPPPPASRPRGASAAPSRCRRAAGRATADPRAPGPATAGNDGRAGGPSR